MRGYCYALSVTQRSPSHSTLIKLSDILSDGTGQIKTRVNSQGSDPLTHREGNDLRRGVTTECETWETWQHNLPNVREVLGTANYCHSRNILTHRELPKIREIFSRAPTSEFGHLLGTSGRFSG